MKLKHVIVAGAVSCTLGSLAFAQQEQSQERRGPAAAGQHGAGQQQERGAMPRGGMMGQERGMHQGAQATQDSKVVQQVQQKLKDEGYQVKVDGIWGPQTQSALREYQQAEGLEATGQLDEETLADLDIQATPGGEAGEPAAGTMPGAADQEKQQQQPPGGQQDKPQQ